MHPFFQHPGVRRCRTLFRWFRISILLILFLVVAAVAYLRLIGLPDFVKRPLLRGLSAKGVAAQFSKMQLGWGRGPSIIIENADFSRSDQRLSPRLSASRGELELNWNALLHSRIELDSLQVLSAELRLPVSETNDDALMLTNMALDVQFYTNDVVQVNNCQATFLGVRVDIIGGVSHASALRNLKFPLHGGGTNTFQTRLRQLARTVEKIHFPGNPLLRIEAGMDGRDLNSFQADLSFTVPAAVTAWGDVTNLVMTAACARLAEPGHEPMTQVRWSAENVATPWAQGRKISFSALLSQDADSNFDAEIQMEAARVRGSWDSTGSNRIDADRLSWNGTATLASSNFTVLKAAGAVHAADFQTQWGLAGAMSLECRAIRVRNPPPPQAGWGSWNRLSPWALDWRAELTNVTNPKLHFKHLAFSGNWRAPQIAIENLAGELYGGQISAGVILDIASRELHCAGVTDFDPQALSPLFKPSAQKWLAQFAWTTPPKVNAQLRVVLPPWTNRPPGWAADVGSSLQLAGDFKVGPSSYLLAPVSSAEGHVTYTNYVWRVAGLHGVRPDGDFYLDYTSSLQGYRYIVDGRMNPKDVIPLLSPGQKHSLDEFSFNQPPAVHADACGRWRGSGYSGFNATVRATNFIARGEPVGILNAAVDYTNQVLTVHNLLLSNAQCRVQAPWVQAELATNSVLGMVRLTNATGSVDPRLLQRLLREQSPPFLNFIHFDTPPSVSVSGSFSPANDLATDLHFAVSGRRIHYTNLLADRATGQVEWIGRTVTLTNIVANLYNNGSLTGWIIFDSRRRNGTDFRLNVAAQNIDLSSLVTGITEKTNHVEGRLDGTLAVSGPYSANRYNWQGNGRIHVHDALLWDIKLFGLLSPVLNAISPGWGHSRAREASATFVITNGLISSDDLEMVCQGFRLNVRGTVNQNKQINARLEAILSRETPVLGPFLSFAFTPLSKLFEYHISGPLQNPVMEPVYVPKFIMLLLRPFHTLKSITTPDNPPDLTPMPGPDNKK